MRAKKPSRSGSRISGPPRLVVSPSAWVCRLRRMGCAIGGFAEVCRGYCRVSTQRALTRVPNAFPFGARNSSSHACTLLIRARVAQSGAGTGMEAMLCTCGCLGLGISPPAFLVFHGAPARNTKRNGHPADDDCALCAPAHVRVIILPVVLVFAGLR